MTDSNKIPIKRWVLVSIVCGFSAGAAYAIPISAPLPQVIGYLLFSLFGPLLCMAIISMYMFLKEFKNSIALNLGALLLVIAGGLVTLMGAMQGASRIYMNDLLADEKFTESTRTAWDMAYQSANALQLGVDIAWDIFLFLGVILLGIALSNHPKFGKWLGWPGILIGVSGTVLNFWTFPNPPDTAGLIDTGPLVGLWFLALTIQMIRCYRKL